MAASDFEREYTLALDEELNAYKKKALSIVKSNLPTFNGTKGNGVSLAGKNLYATGALRSSYYLDDSWGEIIISPGEDTEEYAYYYANGRGNSKTYHGYDFIGQSIRDLEEWNKT